MLRWYLSLLRGTQHDRQLIRNKKNEEIHIGLKHDVWMPYPLCTLSAIYEHDEIMIYATNFYNLWIRLNSTTYTYYYIRTSTRHMRCETSSIFSYFNFDLSFESKFDFVFTFSTHICIYSPALGLMIISICKLWR